jgi:hypothetical protein
MHTVSSRQPVSQRLPLAVHLYGEQEAAIAGRQVPAPSQRRGDEKTLPWQDSAAHNVPAA